MNPSLLHLHSVPFANTSNLLDRLHMKYLLVVLILTFLGVAHKGQGALSLGYTKDLRRFAVHQSAINKMSAYPRLRRKFIVLSVNDKRKLESILAGSYVLEI